jgi:hypoxanthine-DNA glycosylase
MKDTSTHTHPIRPIYDEHSAILILGSFPSVKSRETGFYYGHPQNRFWKTLSVILDSELPLTVKSKTEFLLSHRIALWDVIAECDICGSSDSSITNVVTNDLSVILNKSDIKAVFTNGNTATKLYNKYIFPKTGLNSIPLPSTSPANASYSLERLCHAWGKIKEFI